MSIPNLKKKKEKKEKHPSIIIILSTFYKVISEKNQGKLKRVH